MNQSEEIKSAEAMYMEVQQRTPATFGAYTLPEKWQLEAMEEYANQNKADDPLEIKLQKCLDKMLNGEKLEKVVYYHSGATFVKTNKRSFMIRFESYNPPIAVLD